MIDRNPPSPSKTKFFNDYGDLDKLDWHLLESWPWKDTEINRERKRRRQAEFLVYRVFPWSLIHAIGMLESRKAKYLDKLLSVQDHKPKLVVQSDWYFGRET